MLDPTVGAVSVPVRASHHGALPARAPARSTLHRIRHAAPDTPPTRVSGASGFPTTRGLSSGDRHGVPCALDPAPGSRPNRGLPAGPGWCRAYRPAKVPPDVDASWGAHSGIPASPPSPPPPGSRGDRAWHARLAVRDRAGGRAGRGVPGRWRLPPVSRMIVGPRTGVPIAHTPRRPWATGHRGGCPRSARAGSRALRRPLPPVPVAPFPPGGCAAPPPGVGGGGGVPTPPGVSSASEGDAAPDAGRTRPRGDRSSDKAPGAVSPRNAPTCPRAGCRAVLARWRPPPAPRATRAPGQSDGRRRPFRARPSAPALPRGASATPRQAGTAPGGRSVTRTRARALGVHQADRRGYRAGRCCRGDPRGTPGCGAARPPGGTAGGARGGSEPPGVARRVTVAQRLHTGGRGPGARGGRAARLARGVPAGQRLRAGAGGHTTGGAGRPGRHAA